MTPRLSVIIPTRDRPELLRDCLQTVQRQRVVDDRLEVVVVDDGSERELGPVIESAPGQVPVRLVRQDPEGLNPARNRGAEAAAGDLLAFVDDDTLLASSWAEAVLAAFEHRACAGMAGRVKLRFEGDAPSWVARPQREYLAEFDLGERPRWLDQGPVPVGANCAVRRSELDRVGGFRPGLDRVGGSLVSNGDVEFFRRLRRLGGRLRYEPGAQVAHRVGAERLTREFFRRRAYAQGVSDALLAAEDGPPWVVRVTREGWRCGRTAPVLARGLLTGQGSMNALQWASYCRGRLRATVADGRR